MPTQSARHIATGSGMREKQIVCIRSIRFIGLFQVLLVYSTESAEMAQEKKRFFFMSKAKTI